MKRIGLWACNSGPMVAMDRLVDLVRDGAYTIMHGSSSLEQVHFIKRRYPTSEILIRFHCPDWIDKDPEVWAGEVAAGMHNYAGLTNRVTWANEQNLEPNACFNKERYQWLFSWNGRVAKRLRALKPDSILHLPAVAGGHSEDQDDLGFVAFLLPEALNAVSLCDYVDAHCYWSPIDGPLQEMGERGGGLRYRKLYRLLANACMPKPIWIDEAGPWGQPWKVEQVLAHSQAVAADGFHYCTYFLWADPTNNPGNTLNQWYGRVPDPKLDWLRDQWAKEVVTVPIPVPSRELPDWIVDVINTLPKHTMKRYERRTRPIDTIVVHHTASKPTTSAAVVARYHVMEPPLGRGWPGIAYHVYIGSDGLVELTQPLDIVSYHAGDANRTSVGVCFAGDFTQAPPTAQQMVSGKLVIAWLLDKYGLQNDAVLGHGDLMDTACPGGDWWKALLPAEPEYTKVSEAVALIRDAMVSVTKVYTLVCLLAEQMKDELDALMTQLEDAREKLAG